MRKVSLERYAFQIREFILIDSKLYKEWLTLEKDKQLTDEKEVCKGTRELGGKLQSIASESRPKSLSNVFRQFCLMI